MECNIGSVMVEPLNVSLQTNGDMNHYKHMAAVTLDETLDWNDSENILPLTMFIETKSYRKIIFGYALPVVIIVTTLVNVLVFSVLIKPSMRSSINVLLAAIAVSDTLTGLTALPYYLYFYTRDSSHRYIPYAWCYIQKLTSGIFPTIFHTISVWLTVTLAVQRYIYLCHSLKAKRLCTVRRMTHTVLIVSMMAFLLHGVRLFDSRFVKVTLDIDGESGSIDTCAEIQLPWVDNYQNLYYPIYYWSRVVLIHVLPSIGLVVLNIVLVYVMRATNRKRRLLILQNRHSEWRRIRETNITTFMLTIVVSAFLLVETPLGVLTLLATFKSQYGINVLNDSDLMDMLTVAFNFVMLLSYPLNFFLYVSMSKKFRTEMRKTLCYQPKANDSVGTIQTSREKSSSMELIKTIFTVIAVPTGRKTSTNSSATTNSINSLPQPLTTTSNGLVEYERFNPTCRCHCKHCTDRCQKPKNLVNVSTYAGELDEYYCNDDDRIRFY